VLPVPIQVRCERIGVDRILLQKTPQGLGGEEVGLRELPEFLDELLNRDSFGGGNHRLVRG
jgi:hypothetical protein